MKLTFTDNAPPPLQIPTSHDFEATLKKFKGLYCPKRIKRPAHLRGWRFYGEQYRQDGIEYNEALAKGSW